MKGNNHLFERYDKVPLTQIDERYSDLRLVDPKAEAQMVKSMHTYGQVSPVVVGQSAADRYELIDGFKRLRASFKLGRKDININVFKGAPRVLKAAMLSLNWKSRSIVALEEAMIVSSLCREDGLSQIEVAILLGRHKSWVSRRLSMSERLSQDIFANIKLGLINSTIARELVRLPRGNQEEALQAIIKFSLTSRETAVLISHLLKEPRWNHASVLDHPRDILEKRNQTHRQKHHEPTEFLSIIIAIERQILGLEKLLPDALQIDDQDRDLALSVIGRIFSVMNGIKSKYDGSF